MLQVPGAALLTTGMFMASPETYFIFHFEYFTCDSFPVGYHNGKLALEIIIQMSLQNQCGTIALACFRSLSSWHPTYRGLPTSSSLATSKPWITPMLKVGPWILFRSLANTTTLLSGSFLIMCRRMIYACSLHMWHWSPFNVSRPFYAKTWKTLSLTSLNIDELASILGVFMRNDLPSSLSSLSTGPEIFVS